MSFHALFFKVRNIPVQLTDLALQQARYCACFTQKMKLLVENKHTYSLQSLSLFFFVVFLFLCFFCGEVGIARGHPASQRLQEFEYYQTEYSE
jgi:hypothetical protein